MSEFENCSRNNSSKNNPFLNNSPINIPSSIYNNSSVNNSSVNNSSINNSSANNSPINNSCVNNSCVNNSYIDISSCIICCDKIIETSEEGLNTRKDSTNHLAHLFRTFCKYNNWDSELEYNFENELFPFCKACKVFVVQIYRLDNSIETILNQIRQIVTKVSSKIVLSEVERKRSEANNGTVRNSIYPPSNFNSTSVQQTDGEREVEMSEKNLYYRSLTLERFSPSVSLNSQTESLPEDDEEPAFPEQQQQQQQLHSHVLQQLVKLKEESDVESDTSLNLPQSPASTSDDANIKCEIVIKEEPEESLSFLSNDQLAMSQEPTINFTSESSITLREETRPSVQNGIPPASSPEEACKPKGNKCVQISSTKFIYADMYPFEVIENRFQCGSCSFFTLKKRCNLLQHIRSNHMSGVQKHICQTCGKSYSNKICYKFHLETHTDNPCYTCEFCGKEFKLIYNYRSHKRYSHGGDDLKKYECKYCGKKFWKNREMTLHSKIHTERHVPKTTCKICGEVVDKKSIDLHIKELHFG